MPRIKTTKTVRFALWALRIYLLILLTLIGLKFVRVFATPHRPANEAARPSATAMTNRPERDAEP
jgi:hypothetical protein